MPIERTTLSDLRYARKALRAIGDRIAQESAETELSTEVYQIAMTALDETEEETVPFHRADGRCVCTECLSQYREHPLDRRPAAMSDQSLPFLRVLCNGERVKL